MADNKLSQVAETTDNTGAEIHIIKPLGGGIFKSWRIKIENFLKYFVTSFIDFTTGLTNPIYFKGRTFYDDTKNALSYYNDISDITINIGQEVIIPVYNQTGVTIPNGSLVYPDGTFGDKHTVRLADNRFKAKCRLVAMATHDILNNSSGYVTRIGSVGDVDTLAYTGLLYLGINGLFTDTAPDDGAYRIQIGAVKEQGVNGSITVDPYINDLTVEVTDTNGFPADQKAGTTLSVVDGTRTFTITPTGADFHFYELGDKYEFSTPQNVIFTDVEGSHWFYFDSGVLTATANPTNEQKKAVILNKCFIAIVYWNETDNKSEFDIFEERHGIGMAPQTHLYLHITRGAQFGNGYGLANFVPGGNGSLDVHAQFSAAAGTYYDEDIQHIFTGKSVGDTITVVYLEGINGDLKTEDTTNFAVFPAPGGTLYFNEFTGGAWQLTQTGNNNFILYHIFALNGVNKQIASIMGQNQYATLSAARAGATTEISSILAAFDLQETVPIGTIIFKCNTAYTNTVKAAIQEVETGVNYVDWRVTELAEGTAPTSHANLTELQKAAAGVAWGHIDDLAQTIAGAKTFTDNFKSEGQAHSGDFLKAFSATATFDANNGTNQKMIVTASTSIAITNELPGTYLIKLEIDSALSPTITIGASFGLPFDNTPALINADNNINTITLHVDPDGSKNYTISTVTT